ncbi:hypothetical protein HZA45_01200 [Candidatus Peregrinibacteria bacterium]|nr:hypothetical protein [Candidatus Peregrinibacteria bacterium]
MYSLFMSIVILAGSGLFGFLIATVLLGKRDAFSVGGLSVVLGPATFLFAANALGYAIPIQTAFWVVLVAMIVCDAVLLLSGWLQGTLPRWKSFDVPPRWITVCLLLVIALCTFANMRFGGSDALTWPHFPLAATISEGNFPVKEPINPDQTMAYHYGGALLAAAVRALTGLSVAAGFGFQPLFGVAGILLCAGGLIYSLTKSWRAAFLGAVLTLGGTGLVWFNGVWLLRDLFEKFVLHYPIAYPFRGLAPMFGSPVTSSLLIFLGHRSFMNGYPILFALLLCFQHAFEEKKRSRLMLWIILGIILMSALALTLETAFALLFPALFSYIVVLFLFFPRRREMRMQTLLVSAAVLIPSLLIARVQGGTLFSSGGDVGADSFTFGLFSSIFLSLEGATVAVWQWEFIRDFGLPLLLFPFAVWYCIRKRSTSPFLLLLCIFGFGHFLAPFVVRFTTRPTDFNRLFFTATSIFSLLAALWIDATLLSHRKHVWRWIGGVFLVAMLLSSTVYVSFRALFPTSRAEAAPIFAGMPAASASEFQLFDWVKAHTTLADRFYIRIIPAIAEGRTDVPDSEAYQLDRIRFMAYTGRFSVGPLSQWWYYPPTLTEPSLAIEKSCSIDAFRALKIRYLVVETADRAAWFSALCRAKNWVVRYEGGTKKMAYPQIYEINEKE